MDRNTAEEIVSTVTIKVLQYSAVSVSDCLSLLGEELFSVMMKDPIRKLGPNTETVYPWNLVDYLSNPNLGRTHCDNA